ncbi:MAG TPA: MMPL family transporter [Dermatophilaceae bacterium]|nr:MMPL family transporter [Dermatophilaceae bacterium]
MTDRPGPARRGRHRAVAPRRLVRLGRFVARHRRWVVLAWAVGVVLAFATAVGGVTGESLFERLSSGEPSVDAEAQAGRDLLRSADGEGGQTIVQVSGVPVGQPGVAAVTAELARRLASVPDVAQVTTPFSVPGGVRGPAAAPLLGGGSPASGKFVVVVTRSPTPSTPEVDTAERVREVAAAAFAPLTGASVHVGGVALLVDDITTQVEVDLRIGEGVALPVSLLLMVFVFGGLVAAGMPIVGAVASIGGGLASLLGFSHLIDLDATVVNIVTVLGLGLCIDYGLLVVSRYREELRAIARQTRPRDITTDQVVLAAGRTVATAGRTVLFSGVTVGICLGGLMVFESSLIRAIGAAAASVVAVAVLVALTLVPALCAMGARRLVRKGTEVSPDEGWFSWLAHRVQRRPVLVVVAVTALLVAAALPALGLRTTSSGTGLLPQGADQRTFFETLGRDYPAFSDPEVTVVARTTPTELGTWAASKRSLPDVVAVEPPRQLDDGYAAVGFRTPNGELGDQARDLVTRLREDRPAFPTWVTGAAAGLADFNASARQRAPYAVALVALATLVLLYLMTGSIVIPVKALLLNVISLGASLGVVVWVFQQGHLEGLLGFTSVGAIESTIPLLLFAFGFGLSMDYEVFLLSRIVELHDQGHGDNESVVLGLQRSGRIITSAAILIVIVFAGFVAGKLLIIKETGVALAFAVLVDATLVRILLVPATMTLLGRWNWWAPAPLRRWHARHGIAEAG